MYLVPAILALAATSSCHTLRMSKRATYSGVATFNDYAAQSNTVSYIPWPIMLGQPIRNDKRIVPITSIERSPDT